MKRVKNFAIAFVAALALAAPVVFAQTTTTSANPPAGGQGHRRWHHGGDMSGGMFMLSKLNLTDDQKTQIKQIRASHHQNMASVMSQIRAKRQEINQASQSGAFDQALATQKLTEIAPLEAQMMADHFKERQEMMAVLTPDQKTQLDQLQQQFKANRQAQRGQRFQKNQQIQQ